MEGKELEIVIGKTFSGKTTYVNNLKDVEVLRTHTTRPIRPTETGNEYYFEKAMPDKEQSNIIGFKTYHTIEGEWSYWFDLNDIPIGTKSVVVLDIDGALEVTKYLQKDNHNKVTVTYIDTPAHEIVERINNSVRGKTEDIKESLRRLADDLRIFWVLDWIVVTEQYSNYDYGTFPVIDYNEYSAIAKMGYKIDVTYFFSDGYKDEIINKLPELRF